MKRFLLILLAAALATVCGSAAAEDAPATEADASTVFFGHYEQDGDPDNGDEPIEWLVLDARDGQALLLSRYALDCQPYHGGKKAVAWEDSSLRAWLNGSFLADAFTDAEREAVMTSTQRNDRSKGNVEWTTSGGGDTRDRVFLLSYNEVGVYLSSNEARKTVGTKQERSREAKFMGVISVGNGETSWWLRSPGRKQSEAAFIDASGNFGSRSSGEKLGIRPVILLDTTVDRSSLPYARYQHAAALMAGEQFKEAAETFEALGTYNDSVALAMECRYRQATVAAQSGDYATATALFEALDDYADSYEQGRESRYLDAVAHQEAGDFEAAIQLFSLNGQYKDGMARMKTCFEREGISVSYLSADPVNAGMDKGYAQSQKIGGSDVHFGWRLGRFFMSGHTRAIDRGDDGPVFIKTLGDSITLWFELEQDIDKLNGNDDLSIASDKNGYDEYFGVRKTDFGRGTLIVRHTDYQNAQGEPTIYTDYLLAKGASGADTKIVLQEEGDYEVALDYEIEDGNIRHIANKYNDYRVFFRFSIRNGNCMVYPFDVATGAELQNTAVTPNGFTLDLARSRYLDIDVKRSVLVQSATGVVEDERFNRPAKDGDRYTQEGIYTISVSNRYTGESTTKTLFVGSDELLEEYVANGFSMDRLK